MLNNRVQRHYFEPGTLKSKLKNRLSGVSAADLFLHPLVIHFGYHKCLTSYHMQIFNRLSFEFSFRYQHFATRYQDFEAAAVSDIEQNRVYSVNNFSAVNWQRLPDYRGSHFIRDPRCLVTSGYHYHLWTRESWCRDPAFKWQRIVSHPYFALYIDDDASNYPNKISYQKYVNTLGLEKGLILEMIWRTRHFEQMLGWNFNNPRIIEIRYEDLIGHEVEAFNSIFEHYGFHPRLISRGLEVVERFSLKNQRKSETRHIRSGETKQWVKEFSPLHKRLFKDVYGELLVKLNYENDLSW